MPCGWWVSSRSGIRRTTVQGVDRVVRSIASTTGASLGPPDTVPATTPAAAITTTVRIATKTLGKFTDG
jgi:hypothetical protein